MMAANQRLNHIVTQALNTSPKSREIHDKYYKKTFTYGMKEKHSIPAFLEVNYNNLKTPSRLALAMNYSDIQLNTSVHHELTHVLQHNLALEKEIDITPKNEVNDYLACRLIHEAHAFTMQIEGPLHGFFNNICEGKMENLSFYEEYFSCINGKSFLKPYIKNLFKGDVDVDAPSYIDMAGYFYANKFCLLDEKEKRNNIISARKASVASFFSKIGLKNNPLLDEYIGDTLNYLKDNHAHRNQQMEALGLKGKMQENFVFERRQAGLTIEKIIETTHQEENIFLNNEVWQDILQTQDNDRFISSAIFFSNHKNLYQSVVNENTSFKKKYAYLGF